MSQNRYAEDHTKFEVAKSRTSSSPALLSGNGFARDVPPGIMRDVNQDHGALPNEKGFPIQIGSELFRLSGASIMSDGLCCTATVS